MLLILVEGQISVKVGSLGSLRFEHGVYAYVGSAQNGVERRVARHLRRHKHLFWHIDYLLSDERVRILEAFFKSAPREDECKVAGLIGRISEPVDGFGSSDCRCISHLFKVMDYGSLRRLIENLSFIKLDLEKINMSK